MSLASNKLLKTIYTNENPNEKQTRIGIIKERINFGNHSRYSVQFYGEEEYTAKYYDTVYLDRLLSEGQKVILTKMNGTYIITGRLY